MRMIEVVNMHTRWLVSAVVLLCSVCIVSKADAGPSKTLEKVRTRGHVVCGVSKNSPGFSHVDRTGHWSGFGVDFCAALAAAAIGRADAVVYRSLSAAARLSALKSGDVDVLVHNSSWTLGRATDLGLRYVSPLFYEGMALLVRRDQNIASAMELAGGAFCTLAATPSPRDIASYFGSRKMAYEIVTFDTWDEAVKAFKSKRCQVLSAESSTIAVQLASMPDKSEYMILPEMIAQEAMAPAVRSGDEGWYEIVRWTVFALIKAEELGLSRKNVEGLRAQDNKRVQQFLGVDGHTGKTLGLSKTWTYLVVSQVGNYGDIFERNFGADSPLKMSRGLNHLWSDGGLLAAPAFR